MDPTSDRGAPASGQQRGAARLLLLFAEEDRPFFAAFEKHLSVLRDEGLIAGWTERAFSSEGEQSASSWPKADLIVPLLSADSMANDVFRSIAEHRLLAEEDGCEMVVPVVVRAAELGPFQRFLVLPRSGRPINQWKHQEDAWEDVVAGLRERLRKDPGNEGQEARLSGRVKWLSMRSLTVFEDTTLDACPGINVFIGLNGTGKSHALKAMYSIVRAPLESTVPDAVDTETYRFWRKLTAVFKSNEIRRRQTANEIPALHLQSEDGDIRFNMPHAGQAILFERNEFRGSRAVFIPSREALSMYEGFTSSYERRELSFDETYYDLCKELSALPLRERAIGAFRGPLDTLENAIGGTVGIAGTRFLVQSSIGEIEAHMVAEGMRKLASLAYLLRNGALAERTILFWDEPEANLSPALVTLVARILRELAALGVQIFVATHDYLLSRKLSLAAEYKTAPDVEIRFHSFHRKDMNGPVEIEAADTFAALQHNAILDEFRAHYAREQALFYSPDGAAKEVACEPTVDFAEGALVFRFGAGWSVKKYDDHADYKAGIMRLAGTKAVDFVGVHEGQEDGQRFRHLHLIEVKDFRGYRVQNRQRVADGELAVEVAIKVRDTIAGIVGAHQGTWGPERWGAVVASLAGRHPIRVSLWLEEDHPASRTMPAPPSPALIDDLKKHLAWLRARVLVLNRATATGHVPSLMVENR